MAIPDFQTPLLPVLQHLADCNGGNRREVVLRVGQ
jgi:hypothetical protein